MRKKLLSFPVSHLSSGIFKKKWKPKHLRVFDDGFMEIYNERSSIELEAKVNLLKIQQHLLIGKNILLGQIKKLPNNTNVCLLMGYPESHFEKKPEHKWVLFNSGHDLRKFHEILRQLRKAEEDSRKAGKDGRRPGQQLGRSTSYNSTTGSGVVYTTYLYGPENDNETTAQYQYQPMDDVV